MRRPNREELIALAKGDPEAIADLVLQLLDRVEALENLRPTSPSSSATAVRGASRLPPTRATSPIHPSPRACAQRAAPRPFLPPSAPAQRRLQGPPAKRNFLAVSEKEVKFCRVIESQASQVPFYYYGSISDQPTSIHQEVWPPCGRNIRNACLCER